MSEIVVLDSSALLAVLLVEPGGERVIPVLQGALISTVNVVETYTQLQLRGAHPDPGWTRILELGCEICPFDIEHARIAGRLIHSTRPYGLSLGDRACLALAIERRAIVYTTDKVWRQLSIGVTIEVIR